jgi:aryl-alcohol dehydrogenase-like predicted oxidoreductase
MPLLEDSSPIALGTAGLGSAIPRDAAFQLLDAYREAGGNHLDTAHDYASWLPGGAGASERTIGAWLGRVGGREHLLIATKIGCTQQNVKRIRREILREELALSLERLQLPRVDFLWLHRDDPAVPVEDILGWVEELRREGLFLECGASNWTASRLEQATAAAKAMGVPGFRASQCGYNLAALVADRLPDGDARFVHPEELAWYRANQFPLVAYESQAGGFFSGRYARDRQPDSSRAKITLIHYAAEPNWRRLEIAQTIALAHDASMNQVALAWLRQRPFPVVPIVGANNPDQLRDSLGAVRLRLSAEEIDRLDQAPVAAK